MRLDRLILKDFLTYENLDYTFLNKPLLIQGLNLTDDGQTTNGTGKSGMQTGIEYCITASNSRDVRDNEIVSYGKKKANAQLFASCDVRKETIHIDWDIKPSGSNVLRLKKKRYDEDWREDDSQDVNFSNVNDGKKYIMDWFAICKEDLFSYYLINNTRFKSFFKSSNTEKVALVNRFSDASIVEGLEKIDTKELEAEISKEKTLIDETKGKISFVETQLEKEESRDLEAEVLDKIEEIDSTISDHVDEIGYLKEKQTHLLGNIEETKVKIQNCVDLNSKMEQEKAPIYEDIDEAEKKLEKINVELTKAKAAIDNFKATDFNENRIKLNESISKKKVDLKKLNAADVDLENKSSKITILLNEISVKLAGAIECPKCNHKFLLGEQTLPELLEKREMAETLKGKLEIADEANKVTVKSVKDAIAELEISVSEINAKESLEISGKSKLQEEFINITKKVDSISGTIKAYSSLLEGITKKGSLRDLEIKSLENSIESIKTKISNYDREIKDNESAIERLNESKLTLKAGDNKEVIEGLKNDLVDLTKLLESHTAKFGLKSNELYKKNQWIQNFKQFRTYLANQSLEIIEYHCNRYLKEIGCDLTVTMEGFKVKADGTIKEEITAIITRELVERTYSSFSGGERARLLFSSILANRFMINETHPYGGLDFLVIDEVLEGLDASGFVGLIDTVKVMDIPVMIVTHVTIDNQCDNILTVVKESGVSTVTYDLKTK